MHEQPAAHAVALTDRLASRLIEQLSQWQTAVQARCHPQELQSCHRQGRPPPFLSDHREHAARRWLQHPPGALNSYRPHGYTSATTPAITRSRCTGLTHRLLFVVVPALPEPQFGKWHAGFFVKEHTPLYRGFNSSYGFLTGKAPHLQLQSTLPPRPLVSHWHLLRPEPERAQLPRTIASVLCFLQVARITTPRQRSVAPPSAASIGSPSISGTLTAQP